MVEVVPEQDAAPPPVLAVVETMRIQAVVSTAVSAVPEQHILPLSKGEAVTVTSVDGMWLFGFRDSAPTITGWFPAHVVAMAE